MGDILAWAAVIVVAIALWMVAGRFSRGRGAGPVDDIDPISGRGVI
jgi:hypothetical protein